jgi:hypothetical protein
MVVVSVLSYKEFFMPPEYHEYVDRLIATAEAKLQEVSNYTRKQKELEKENIRNLPALKELRLLDPDIARAWEENALQEVENSYSPLDTYERVRPHIKWDQ